MRIGRSTRYLLDDLMHDTDSDSWCRLEDESSLLERE